MSGGYEIYIYSKYKDIYILKKILNILNSTKFYQFDPNSIIIKAGKENDKIYDEYSTSDFNLIRHKRNIKGELIKIYFFLILILKNIYFHHGGSLVYLMPKLLKIFLLLKLKIM